MLGSLPTYPITVEITLSLEGSHFSHKESPSQVKPYCASLRTPQAFPHMPFYTERIPPNPKFLGSSLSATLLPSL